MIRVTAKTAVIPETQSLKKILSSRKQLCLQRKFITLSAASENIRKTKVLLHCRFELQATSENTKLEIQQKHLRSC